LWFKFYYVPIPNLLTFLFIFFVNNVNGQ